MEVDPGAICIEVVAYRNLDLVTPVCLDCRAGVLIVDDHHTLLNPVGGKSLELDIKVVLWQHQ